MNANCLWHKHLRTADLWINRTTSSELDLVLSYTIHFLVQESIIELITNPPILHKPLTAKARGRPKGSTTLRLPPTIRTSRQLEAYNKSTRRIPSIGEDYYEIDESALPASTAPPAASTKTGTRRCGNCGELGHYRNLCKNVKQTVLQINSCRYLFSGSSQYYMILRLDYSKFGGAPWSSNFLGGRRE